MRKPEKYLTQTHKIGDHCIFDGNCGTSRGKVSWGYSSGPKVYAEF